MQKAPGPIGDNGKSHSHFSTTNRPTFAYSKHIDLEEIQGEEPFFASNMQFCCVSATSVEDRICLW